jgi:hypothetical protein
VALPADQPAQRAQGRRLARAVASDEAHQLAGRDLQRNATQDAAVLNVDGQLVQRQH